jgi:hypothetical protein
MGRKKDETLRTHFSEPFEGDDGEFKGSRVRCLHCNEIKGISNTAQRMKAHLDGCEAYQAKEEAEFLQLKKAQIIGRQRPRENSDDEVLEIRETRPKKVQKKMDDFIDPMSPAEKEKLWKLLGKAVHRNAENFDIFSDDLWKEFFHALRPGFRLPDRAVIGGSLLIDQYTEVRDEVVSEVMQKLNNFGGQFSIDGVTDVRKRSIHNFVINTPLPRYLTSFQLKTQKETSNNLKTKVIELISSFMPSSLENRGAAFEESPPNSTWKPIISLITDNPSTMKATRRKLTEHFSGNENLTFFAVGCASHALNMVALDLISQPCLKSIQEQVTILVSHFNQTHRSLAYLHRFEKEKYGKTFAIQTFSKTRWNSILMMFNSINSVREAIRMFMVEDLPNPNEDNFQLPDSVYSVIANISFWVKLQASIELLKPLCVVTSYLEGDLISLGSVYGCFLYLIQLYENQSNEFLRENPELRVFIKERLNHRFSQIRSPAHALCFFFDPFWVAFRKKLDQAQLTLAGIPLITEIRSGFKEYSPNSDILRELYCEWSAFSNGEHDFDAENISFGASIHPMIWWESIGRCENLKNLMIRLYQHQATSASGERQFKSRKRVHSSIRSNLKDPRVEKQTFVAFNHMSLKRSLAKYKRLGEFEKTIQEIDFAALLENISLDQEADANEEMDPESDDDLGYVSEGEGAAEGAPVQQRGLEALYCYCRGAETDDMVRCDQCKDWFHFSCAGVTANDIADDRAWFCDPCQTLQ